MRGALGRIVVVVSEEREQGREVPHLIADIAQRAMSKALQSEQLPSRGATVAAPVFARLRRAAAAERSMASVVTRDAFGLPRAGAGASRSPITEALAWLDEGHVRRAFVHAGAPFARRWLRDVLEWARTNPDSKPPELPTDDPLAPPEERDTQQRSARRAGRPKGTTVALSRTRAVALLVLYLVEVEGVSSPAATRRVRERVARVHGAAPDKSSLRRVRNRERLRERNTAATLAQLAPVIVGRHLLPPGTLDRIERTAGSRPYVRLLLRCAVAAVLRSLVKGG